MKATYRFILLIAILLVGTSQLSAKTEELTETFKNAKSLDLNIVSSDCVIKTGKGKEIKVHVEYSSDYDCYEPEITQRGDRVVIRERFMGRRCRSDARWTITIPKGTNVDFSSASGSLTLSGGEGDFFLETASGDIDVSDSKGEFEIDCASGRITITDSQGDFELDNASGRIRLNDVAGDINIDNASGSVELTDVRGKLNVDNASGDVEAEQLTLEGRSSFDTASGDVQLSLATALKHDLEMSSASGDVVLDYDGNTVVGEFRFAARQRHGRIISPFKFDVEELSDIRGDRYYQDATMHKSFTLGKDTPRVYLRTSSGTAELKQ